MGYVLPLFRGEGYSSRLSPFESAGSPPHGVRRFHLWTHGILNLTAGDVHYEFRKLVQIAGSLGHTPLSSVRRATATGMYFKLRHYPALSLRPHQEQ